MSAETPPQPLTQTFKALTKQHSKFLVDQKFESGQANLDPRHFSDLLDGYQQARETWAEQQEATANDFCMFDVLDVVGDENRHSKILAWLLDRRIDRGTHAQGSLGFRLLLEELAEQLKLPDHFADEDYWVRREVAGEDSRMDVEVAAHRLFIIHIENKIWSSEGTRQTNREWSDLLIRANALGVQATNVRGLFLTPDGRPALEESFIPVSWHQIAGVLDRFAELAKPPEVKLFVRHYAEALRKFIITKPEPTEEDDDEATV